MIVMINGSFGVGKTSVANRLREELPNAMIFDPETVGQMLRYTTQGIRTGVEDTEDFQDIELWRTLTVVTAQQLYHQYKRTLIIPMTIANPDYFDQIKSGFAALNIPLYHFCLIAPLTTIHQRLLARGDNERSWCWQKAIEYVPLFDDQRFKEHIDASSVSIQGVINSILGYLPSST